MLSQPQPGAEEARVGLVYYRVPDLDAAYATLRERGAGSWTSRAGSRASRTTSCGWYFLRTRTERPARPHGRAAPDRAERSSGCRESLGGRDVRPRALLPQQGALGEVLPLLKLREFLPQGQLLLLERPNPLGGVVGERGLAEGAAVDQASQRPADAAQDERDRRDERELGDVARSMVGSSGRGQQ